MLKQEQEDRETASRKEEERKEMVDYKNAYFQVEKENLKKKKEN